MSPFPLSPFPFPNAGRRRTTNNQTPPGSSRACCGHAGSDDTGFPIRERQKSPRLPPPFGCSALHQIAGAVLAASDRALPSQRATRIAVLDGVEARFQSHLAGFGWTWNILPGPVLLGVAPLMANPGRR